MKAGKRFAVVGSDARQAAAGRALARAGYAVSGAEQVALSDYILLPLPLDEARTPLAALLRAAKPGALALGGKLSAEAQQIARLRRLADDAQLDPDFAEKFLNFVVKEVIRHHEQIAAGNGELKQNT